MLMLSSICQWSPLISMRGVIFGTIESMHVMVSRPTDRSKVMTSEDTAGNIGQTKGEHSDI